MAYGFNEIETYCDPNTPNYSFRNVTLPAYQGDSNAFVSRSKQTNNTHSYVTASSMTNTSRVSFWIEKSGSRLTDPVNLWSGPYAYPMYYYENVGKGTSINLDARNYNKVTTTATVDGKVDYE